MRLHDRFKRLTLETADVVARPPESDVGLSFHWKFRIPYARRRNLRRLSITSPPN